MKSLFALLALMLATTAFAAEPAVEGVENSGPIRGRITPPGGPHGPVMGVPMNPALVACLRATERRAENTFADDISVDVRDVDCKRTGSNDKGHIYTCKAKDADLARTGMYEIDYRLTRTSCAITHVQVIETAEVPHPRLRGDEAVTE